MTDDQFLAHLEHRTKDKKTMFLVTGDVMERLQNIGRIAKVPPPRPCIKRGVVLEEIRLARCRLAKIEELAARL